MVRPRPRPGRGEQIVELYGLWGQAALSRIDENEPEHLHLGWGYVLVGYHQSDTMALLSRLYAAYRCPRHAAA